MRVEGVIMIPRPPGMTRQSWAQGPGTRARGPEPGTRSPGPGPGAQSEFWRPGMTRFLPTAASAAVRCSPGRTGRGVRPRDATRPDALCSLVQGRPLRDSPGAYKESPRTPARTPPGSKETARNPRGIPTRTVPMLDEKRKTDRKFEKFTSLKV